MFNENEQVQRLAEGTTSDLSKMFQDKKYLIFQEPRRDLTYFYNTREEAEEDGIKIFGLNQDRSNNFVIAENKEYRESSN